MVGKCGTLSASLDKSLGNVVIATNRQFNVNTNKKANNKRHKHRNHLTDRKL